METGKHMRYGIIDVGSNSIRLCVYQGQVDDKPIILLHDEKIMAGLASYVQEDGCLSEQGVSAAIDAIARLCISAGRQGAVETHVFATAVIRNARNCSAVTAAIERACDVDLDVLSGSQEAYLGFKGAQRSVPDADGVFFDIGGGSTEVTYFRNGHMAHCVSLPLGSLNMKVKHVKGTLPTEEEFRAIAREVTGALEEVPEFREVRFPQVYGVGGSVRAAARVLGAFEEEEDAGIGVDHLRRALSVAVSNPCETEEKVRELLPDRVTTLFPGMVIQERLSSFFGAQRIMAATCGVREGYLRGVVLGQW